MDIEEIKIPKSHITKEMEFRIYTQLLEENEWWDEIMAKERTITHIDNFLSAGCMIFKKSSDLHIEDQRYINHRLHQSLVEYDKQINKESWFDWPYYKARILSYFNRGFGLACYAMTNKQPEFFVAEYSQHLAKFNDNWYSHPEIGIAYALLRSEHPATSEVMVFLRHIEKYVPKECLTPFKSAIMPLTTPAQPKAQTERKPQAKTPITLPSATENKQVISEVFHFDSDFFKEQLAQAADICGERKSNFALLEKVLEEKNRVKTVAEHMRFLQALGMMVQLPWPVKEMFGSVKNKYCEHRKHPKNPKDLHMKEMLADCFQS